MTRTISFFHQRQVRRGRWLMGALVLLPAFFFPPRSLHGELSIETINFLNVSPYASLGGIGGQLVNYIRLFRDSPILAGEFLVVVLVPFCLAVATLTLCMVLFWGRFVDRAVRPTLARALLSVLGAISTSLVLTLFLAPVEMILFANDVARGGTLLLTVTPALIVVQLLFAPVLFIGGAILVKFQGSTANR